MDIVTTEGAKKAHLSEEGSLATLCGRYAWTQEMLGQHAGQYGGRTPRIDDMPVCQHCYRADVRRRKKAPTGR